METLFIILFLISFICLIFGLIHPVLFKRFFKNRSLSRKFILKVFGTATIITFFTIGIIADPVEKKPEVKQDNNSKADIAENVQNGEQNLENNIIEETAEDNSESQNQEANISDEPLKIDKQNSTQTNNNQDSYSMVNKVVDGDTIKVVINGSEESVRLIGIDTPESVDPRKPVECFAQEASNRAKEILSNKKVRLESDSTQDDRDKYNRLLRYVWLENGTLFNKQMIIEGYASEYTYQIPYKYQSEFKQAEQEAKNSKVGLWAEGVCLSDDSNNNTTTAADPTENSQPVVQTGGYKWYVSSYRTAKQYYCETDDAWKGLSEKYLEVYNSEQELLKKYPTYTLHKPCE